MMPSRGLQLARGHAPRLYQLQCRTLSLASRRLPSPLVRGNIRSRSPSSKWHASSSIITSSALAVRHASSTPWSAPPLASPPPPNPDDGSSAAAHTPSSAPPMGEQSFPNLDTISIEGIELDSIASASEKLGYLHEIGINYGWGMTSTLQWIIEHLHISAGLPWWGSIAATAVLMRLVLLPLFLRSSDIMARTAALQPVTKPIQDRIKEARANGDRDGLRDAGMELMAMRRRAGLSFPKQILPLVAQGYIAFCGFRLIRAMATLPVPAFVTEGPLWLQDLTLSDPYLILPLAMAGTLHVLARMGGETGAAASDVMTPGMQNMMLYFLPCIVVLALGYQPAALCIWFAAGGFIGITQALLLRRPAVRKYLGIAPLYKPVKSETPDSLMDQLWPSAKPKAARERPNVAPMGKNGAYMNPVYQSPKLNRSSSTRTVIDVKASTKAQYPRSAAASSATAHSDMVQPNRPRQGVVDEVSKAWTNLGQQKQKKKQGKGR